MKSEEQRKHVASELAWTATGTPGVEKKVLVAGNESGMHEVSILRLEPGARLPPLHEGWGIEVVVLEGSWQLPEGILEENGYSRRPPGEMDAGSTATGCTLYVRSGPFAEDDRELVHLQAGEEPWLAGQGNLRVKPLHSMGSVVLEGSWQLPEGILEENGYSRRPPGEMDAGSTATGCTLGGTALVHWPAGERFIPHEHWGGEEIFVLSGTFRDEHGTYPKGTWIQSPHLSTHHPFVEGETVIFVKTGHLPGG